MFQDDKFEFGDVVGMDPIFRGVTHEILLASTGGGVAFDGVPAGSYEVVLFGEFYD